MKSRGHAPLAALSALLTLPAFADMPRIDGPSGSASLGADVSNTDSRRIYATGDFELGNRWSASAALARADVDLPGTSTQSTLVGANVSYRFADFSVGGGFRHSEIDGVSRSDDWLARGSWRYHTMRLGLEVAHRAATLAPSAFTADLGGSTGIVSGTSHCDVDGMGYRASMDLDRPTWSGFAALRVYDYDDYDCTLDITPVSGPPPGKGPPPHARGRALGHRLAATTLDTVVGATSRLVPPDASLLDSSLAVGFTTPVSRDWIGGVEIDRDVEKLDGSEYLTGIVSASRMLDSDWTLELSLGYSVAEELENSVFAGVRVITYFRH